MCRALLYPQPYLVLSLSLSLSLSLMQLKTKLLPKPTTTPPISLQSLLPPSLNPYLTTISLISSRLKELHPNSIPLNPTSESHLLPFLTHHSLSSILLQSQSHPLPSLNLLLFFQSHLNLTPSPHNFSILSHTLTFSQYYHHATQTITHFIHTHPHHDIFSSLLSSTNSCNWSPVVFDLLIKVYVQLGRLQEALDTLWRVIQMGFTPNPHSFNFILNSLIKSRNLDLCFEIYAGMRRIGVSPNAYTFNILIHALCRDGDEGKANEFLEEIESEGFDPDIVTYNTLINGYCRRGRFNDALLLYKIMYRRCVEPDLVTYTILIKGLCKEGKMVDARQMFDRMIHRGLNPDSFCFNALISGYCRNGMMRKSRLLLDAMIQYGLKPDGFTCSAMIEGHLKVGKLLPCLNMIAELRKLEIVVSFDNYNWILEALCLERRPNAAKSLLDWMVQDGYEPKLENYNLVIGSFCECCSIVEAFGLKDEMVERDIRPSLDTYRILISNSGKAREGECLMEEMVGSGLVPDSVICAALVSGYCKERNLSKAESVLSYFAREFQIYDNKSFNALMKVYCEEGDMTKSFELQNRMMKLGFVPNGETCKFLIYGLSRSRRLCG